MHIRLCYFIVVVSVNFLSLFVNITYLLYTFFVENPEVVKSFFLIEMEILGRVFAWEA